jgi:hypothetical protein
MSKNGKNKESTLFAVIHIRKIKTMGGCKSVLLHNLRKKLRKDLKEAIDPNLSHYNVYDGVQNFEEFKKKYNEKVENAHLKRKIQRNASRIVEFFIGFSHDYCKNWEKDKKQNDIIDRYFSDCKKFIVQKYGDVILSSTLHKDETTSHLHLLCLPLALSRDGKEVKFSSSTFLGGRWGLNKLHTEFYNQIGKRYGLSRGIEGSRATHIGIKEYKTQEEKKLLELEKERQEVERIKRENQYQKIHIQSIQNDLMRRDAELSKKEKELENAEKSISVQPPEIPIPPVLVTENARKTWRDSIQEIIKKQFLTIVKAYQSISLKYNKLLDDFNKLVSLNENFKKRAEKAEKDLSDKPIKEIIAEREKKKKDEQDKDKHVNKGGNSL